MRYEPFSKTRQAHTLTATCCAKPPQTQREPLHLFQGIQQQIGNQGVGQMVQAKLNISQPDDGYEQEADRVSDEVMRMPEPGATKEQPGTPQIQRMCAGCEEEEPMRKAADEKEEEEDKAPVQLKALSGGTRAASSAAQTGLSNVGSGQTLPESTRTFFEPRLGHDFSDVRVHNDGPAADSARSLNALAFTAGRDIVFAAGKYEPETSEGRRLLAHELTHVVQQKHSSSPRISRKIDRFVLSGCSAEIQLGIGIYGSRANAALATKWQNQINTLWNGTAACRGNSVGTCATRVNATVTAHPAINWWWNVPESNSVFVREPDYRSQVNRALDSGDWAENEDDRSVAHETGHFMGQGDYYWNIPWTSRPSESDYVNDIMANYYQDPGPTVYGPALSRILAANNVDCLCCLRYPPCRANSCALSPFIPCANVGGRRHCEWIRANNRPEALARYTTNCATL